MEEGLRQRKGVGNSNTARIPVEGFSHWKGKGKGKLKGKWKGKQELPFHHGDLLSLSRFDAAQDGNRTGHTLRVVAGASAYTNGVMGFASRKDEKLLRVKWDGTAGVKGHLGGQFTRFRVVLGPNGNIGSSGEVSLYNIKTNLWLTIEPDGGFGSSPTRRDLLYSLTFASEQVSADEKHNHEEEPVSEPDFVREKVSTSGQNEPLHEIADEEAEDAEMHISPELYWSKELHNLPVLDLKSPPLHPMDSYLSHHINMVEHQICILPTDITESVMLAAWSSLLCRLSRAEEVAVGVGEEDPIVVRVPASQEWTLAQLDDVVKGKLAHARRNAHQLDEFLNKDIRSEQPLFQTGFLYGEVLLCSSMLSQQQLQAILTPSWRECPDLKTDGLAFQIRCKPTATGVTLQLLHVLGIVNDSFARRMLVHLENMVCGATDLSSEAEHAALMTWSDLTSSSYDSCAHLCIHDLFQEQASGSPDAHAVIDENRHLTYAMLASASSYIAKQLVHAGVQPDTLVPLMAQRSLEMIVGIYGILFAGAGYAPLDTKWPDERVADVVNQCDPKAICAGPGYHDRLWQLGSQVVDIEIKSNRASSISAFSDRRPGGKGIVYCFFTSGSTGKPKGVIVEHRGLVHRTKWFQERWGGMKPGAYGILKHSYTFGLSEWEIFWPLSFGATLVLCKPDGEKDVEYLWNLSDKYRVRTQVFVPSVLRALLDYAALELQDRPSLWADLRYAITCGEALPQNLAQLFFDFVSHAELDNLYGPTEGEMTVWRCPKGEIIQSVPIGVPMDGSRVLIQAFGHCLASIGEPGEIYFGGQFIARGYLGLERLTAEKFIADEYAGADLDGRLYASGDLARWRETGILDFLGRADFQVKIRGFRIELGEIEEALRNGGAKIAVCVVQGDGSQQRLVAYVTPDSLQVAELRASCTRRLPSYMVPSQFVVMKELPKSANGKIDRKALPGPPEEQVDAGESESAIVKPKNELEERIQEVWAEVLQRPVETLSTEADWPLVGGNSLLAGKATSMLRKQLNVQFPGTTMYTHSTIVKLAELAVKLGAVANSNEMVGKDPDRVDLLVVPAEKRYKGHDADTPSAILPQLFCSILGCAMGDMGSNVLRCSFIWLAYIRFGRGITFLILPFILAIAVVVEATLCILLKHLLVGRLTPGEYPLWSPVYYRWLCGRHIVEKSRDRLSEIISGTPLLAALYRALGARIGRRVDLNDPELEEPDLVSIGDDVEIHHARFGTATIMDGQLFLGRVDIESKCRILPRAMLVMGTYLSEGTEVSSMATTVGWKGHVGAVCPLQSSGITRVQTQDLLRMFLGIPLVLLLHALPYIPVVLALESLWYSCYDSFGLLFWLLAPAIFRHGYAIIFFLLVVLQKRLVVGKLLPGKRPREGIVSWHWDVFRTWLHEQAVCARAFDDAVDPFVGSEVLSMMYRLLGVKVGRRVQIDNFHVAEPDCVTIGDDSVLGSVISIYCGGSTGREPVHLHRGSNVLDHCCIHAGARIGERAVLGSATLAPEGSYFPPESISTGQVGGKPVRLRFQVASDEQQQVEEKAMRRLNSDLWFWSFNTLLILAAMICSPLPHYAAIVTLIMSSLAYDRYGIIVAVLMLPCIHFLLNLILLLANWVIKRCLIGTYREGDYTFFGQYHLSWTVMMILSGVLEDVLDALQGTQLLIWYYRLMGAKVGRNCCLFGLAFEYDLLTIGPCSSIGWECDTTCHTVENMVIKLAPTQLESYSSMLCHSMVSPGARLGRGSVLLENSLVLKGEQVPPDEMWAGLPASSCGAVCSVVNEHGSAADSDAAIDVAKDLPLDSVQPSAPASIEIRMAETPENSDTSKVLQPRIDDNEVGEKAGMAALEESAIVAFKGQADLPSFLVEWLSNGSLCLWTLAPDGRRLTGHLRIRGDGNVDYQGGRGPFAQFVAKAVMACDKIGAGLTLRGKHTGLYLCVDDRNRLVARREPCSLQVQQCVSGMRVLLPMVSQFERQQQGVTSLRARRRSAAYALQSTFWPMVEEHHRKNRKQLRRK